MFYLNLLVFILCTLYTQVYNVHRIQRTRRRRGVILSNNLTLFKFEHTISPPHTQNRTYQQRITHTLQTNQSDLCKRYNMQYASMGGNMHDSIKADYVRHFRLCHQNAAYANITLPVPPPFYAVYMDLGLKEFMPPPAVTAFEAAAAQQKAQSLGGAGATGGVNSGQMMSGVPGQVQPPAAGGPGMVRAPSQLTMNAGSSQPQ